MKQKRKKGWIADMFVFMIVAFALVMGVISLVYVTEKTREKLYENVDAIQAGISDEDNATLLLDNTFGKVPTSQEPLKWITVMLIVGMVIAMIFSAYMVNTRPIFFVPFLFLWVISIIVSVSLSNAYETIYNTPELTSTFEGFWAQTYIFLNLPIWMTVIGGILAIVMFVNMYRGGARGYA